MFQILHGMPFELAYEAPRDYVLHYLFIICFHDIYLARNVGVLLTNMANAICIHDVLAWFGCLLMSILYYLVNDMCFSYHCLLSDTTIITSLVQNINVNGVKASLRSKMQMCMTT